MENNLTWKEFMKVDIRVGTVLSAEIFKEAKKSAYIIVIDFGGLGTRKTSAQLTNLYKPVDLVGKQVLAVVNFPPKQVATIMSECLILGAIGKNGEVTLIQTDRTTENGLRIA